MCQRRSQKNMEHCKTFKLVEEKQFDIHDYLGVRYSLNVFLDFKEFLKFDISGYTTYSILRCADTYDKFCNTINRASIYDQMRIVYFDTLQNGISIIPSDSHYFKSLLDLYMQKSMQKMPYNIVLAFRDDEHQQQIIPRLESCLYESLHSKYKKPFSKKDVPVPSIKIPKVETVSRIPEERKFSIDNYAHFCGNKVEFTDYYCYTNVPYNCFAGRSYNDFMFLSYDPFDKTYESLNDTEHILCDIAKRGFISPIIYFVDDEGQLSQYKSTHRQYAANCLGLPTVPACLIARQFHDKKKPFEYCGSYLVNHNNETVDFVNSKFYPMMYWRKSAKKKNDLLGGEYFQKFLKVRDFLIDEFPNRTYSMKTLPKDLLDYVQA